MKRFREQRGQAMVLTCLFIASLLGMAALVLDAGSWFRTHRNLQAVADAAALAGAHALPNNTIQAAALARDYAAKNGGYSLDRIDFSGKFTGSDTINVHVSEEAPGVFAKVFGIDSVHIGAGASARSSGVSAVKWVAPIVVNEKHPDLGCAQAGGVGPCPITKIHLLNLHKPHGGDAAGAFGLLDLLGGNGSVGDSELADWMDRGFDQYMGKGKYHSVPSAKFNGSNFCQALMSHIKPGLEPPHVVYFPIYRDPIIGSGANAEFDIIGWVAFEVHNADCRGSKGWVEGRFVPNSIVEGIQAEGGEPDFGLKAIELVE